MRHIALFIFFLTLIPLQAHTQNQNSVEGDRQALEALYNATDGRNWKNSSGWLNGNPSDSWYGVEVNGEGRVIRLNLADNNLNGELPQTIGNWSKLEYFNVKRNNLTGDIPETIGAWAEIHTLYFSGNRADDLPSRVSNSYHTGKSDRSGNNFSGHFPDVYANFGKLEIFELAGSSLTRIFYPSIGQASKLRYIVAAWNKQTSEQLPSELGNLRNLQWFLVARSNFTGHIFDLTQMPDLRQFQVSNTKMDGPIPDFSNNTLLRRIGIAGSSTNFTGEWPHYFNNGEFTQLSTVTASHNDITGTLHGFENLTNLGVFNLDGNNLSGSIPESITQAERLIILGLGWNNFTGEIPQDGWGNHTGTRYIRLVNNNLTGPIPDELPNSDKLQYLYFGNNNLSGPISLEGAKYNDSSTYDRFNYIDISNNAFSESDYKPLLDELGSSKLRVGDQNPDDSGSTEEPTTPSTPSLQSPSNDASNVSVNPTFSWSSVSADSYTLRVHTSGGSLVFENSGSGTSYTTSSNRTLDHDTEYSWRVRATKDGVHSEWSSSRSFKTENDGGGDDSSGSGGDPLTSPELTSPKDGATGVSLTPTLQWSSVDADYYILHLGTSTTNGIVVDAEVNGTSYSVKNNESLDPETIYKWRVRGVKDGVEGEWSPVTEFTTQINDEEKGNNGKGPQKFTPAKDEKKVSKKATFEWEAVEDADSYTIEIREASTFSLFVEEEVKETMFVTSREMKGSTDYVWRVRATVQGQTGEWSEEWEFTTVGENEEMAFEVELNQNYPNPFNPSTNIQFTLAEQQEVSLKVYDMAGRLVASLIDGITLSGGTHDASFNAQSLASGIYFYRLITPGEIVTRKMTLMK